MKHNLKISVSKPTTNGSGSHGATKGTDRLLNEIFGDASKLNITIPKGAVTEITITATDEGGAENAT